MCNSDINVLIWKEVITRMCPQRARQGGRERQRVYKRKRWGKDRTFGFCRAERHMHIMSSASCILLYYFKWLCSVINLYYLAAQLCFNSHNLHLINVQQSFNWLWNSLYASIWHSLTNKFISDKTGYFYIVILVNTWKRCFIIRAALVCLWWLCCLVITKTPQTFIHDGCYVSLMHTPWNKRVTTCNNSHSNNIHLSFTKHLLSIHTVL